jgi:hypothetical protein
VQEPELRYNQEQKENAGPARVQEVLQKVQESHSAQRDEMIAECRFPFAEGTKQTRSNRQSPI